VIRHNIHAGNSAPARLMTGAYPAETIEPPPPPTSALIEDTELNVSSRSTLMLRHLREVKRRTKS
jgi:hypothetical protein